MPTYTPRTTSPAGTFNACWMTNLYGGSWNNNWNTSIYGSPVINGADVLANCVGYAQGRSIEIWMHFTGDNPVSAGNTHPFTMFNVDAGDWVQVAQQYGFTVDQNPSLGAIVVTPNHVAICEEKVNDDLWYVSESGYGTMPEFFYQTSLYRSDGVWYESFSSPSKNVIGFIRNPYVDDHPEPPTPKSRNKFIYNRNWNNWRFRMLYH